MQNVICNNKKKNCKVKTFDNFIKKKKKNFLKVQMPTMFFFYNRIEKKNLEIHDSTMRFFFKLILFIVHLCPDLSKLKRK